MKKIISSVAEIPNTLISLHSIFLWKSAISYANKKIQNCGEAQLSYPE